MKKTLASYIGVRCIIVSYRKWTKKQEGMYLFVRIAPAFLSCSRIIRTESLLLGGAGASEKRKRERNVMIGGMKKQEYQRKQLTKTLRFLSRSGAFPKAVSCSGVGGEWRKERPQTFRLWCSVLSVSFRPLRL